MTAGVQEALAAACGRAWPSGYLERRMKASAFVHEAMHGSGVAAGAVRGSWRHGDFHLSLGSTVSFSDLDLVVMGTVDELVRLSDELAGRLISTLRLKIAIHPVESMAGMSLEDARLLLIGEYIISMARKVPTGLMSADYVRAKIALLFLRSRLDERYLDVARRTGCEGAAAQVKLGGGDRFSAGQMASCLSSVDDANTRRFVDGCLFGGPDRRFLRGWAEDVVRAPSVDPWLKEFVVTRVEQSLVR